MTSTILSTTKDAIDFISSHLARDEAPDVTVTGELALFSMHIEGQEYNASFPSEFARGLWEFQEAIYNAVAFALYGIEDIRRLTVQQKEDFKIVFSVDKGSLDLQAMLEKFFEKLSEGFVNMDSKHKAVTIASVALVIATAYGAVHIVEANSDEKKAEIASHTQIAQEQERTAQFKVIADAIEQNKISAGFAKATEEGTRAIIKRAQGATDIRVGHVKFDHEEIEEVNQRAAKEKAEAQMITGDFSILRVETRDSSTTKLVMSSKDLGEFSAVMLDEDFLADDLNKLWSAVKNREKISLEVNATMIRGSVKTAQIVKIF